jgi:DNA polymerase-3 subunit beta
MNIVCTKANLLNGVQIVAKALSSKTTMSILECILFEAHDTEIKLTASDTELGIETKIDGLVVKEGRVALDGKQLLEFIRKLPDVDVAISCDENFKTEVTTVSPKRKYDIVGRSGEDFSYLPKIEKLDSITVSQFTLKEIIRQTIFSVSNNDSNIKMTGELFEIEGGVLKVCSLDGQRISIRKVELKDKYPSRKVIVPGKTLNEISKILAGETDKDVTIYFTGKHVVFEFDETVVVSRLIEGEYIRFEQLLSSDYETKINVNKKELLDCLDGSTPLISENDKKPIIINIVDNLMDLKMTTVRGNMMGEIEIDKKGKNLMIAFNPKFLIDALKVIDDETIDIYMVNPKAPCFIRNTDESYNYLIMPVNFTTVN